MKTNEIAQTGLKIENIFPANIKEETVTKNGNILDIFLKLDGTAHFPQYK